MPARKTFIVELRPGPGTDERWVERKELAQFLKALGRRYGFDCVGIGVKESPQAAGETCSSPPNPGDAPAAPVPRVK